jgi:hypothetical protein
VAQQSMLQMQSYWLFIVVWLHPIYSVEFSNGTYFGRFDSSQCDHSDQIAALQLLERDPF